jgi:protein-S-isoprenylcysteine O-methyltransferase Ste14
MAAASSRGPGVRTPPPALYLIGFLAGLGLHRVVPGDVFPAGAMGALRVAGWGAMAAGFALAASALVSFRRAGTTVAPVRESTTLVAYGPYRFTRNPMYVSLSLTYMGVALAVDRAWPLLFLPVVLLVIQWAVIRKEEEYLEERFGEAYESYRRRVPRWLGPPGR